MRNTPFFMRIVLFFSSLVVTLVLIEILLRSAGGIYILGQDFSNQRKLKEDTIRILCIGESTTASGGEYSYPTQLEKILNTNSNHQRFHVINKGIPGQSTRYIVGHIEEWVKEYHPHLVVAMMGINDNLDRVPFIHKENDFSLKTSLQNLRVVKLYRWIQTALMNRKTKGENKPAEETAVDFHLKKKSNEYKKLYITYLVLEGKGDYRSAEKIIRGLISVESNLNDQRKLYKKLYQLLRKQKKYKHMVLMFDKVPLYVWGIDWIKVVCHSPEGVLNTERVLFSIIKQKPEPYPYYDVLGACYEEGHDFVRANQAREKGRNLRERAFNKKTQVNYVYMANLLKRYQISGVFVQYPLRNMATLRNMLSDQINIEDYYFVDNEKIFQDAIEREGFEEYFYDRFAGDFGHCTAKGNGMLAENVANTIFNEVLK